MQAQCASVGRGGHLAAARHLNYLERDGIESDGSPGQFYDARGPVDRAAFAEPLLRERRQFRFIISPEDDRRVDLRALARDLVEQMERDLGPPLLWAAVNHHDAGNRHVHLIIKGVDANGQPVRFPERYIKQDLRVRAQQLLTRKLGLRTAADIARERRWEIDRERFTSFDRIIEGLVGPDGGLEAKPVAGLGGPLRGAVLARLATLARLGMATGGARGCWQLAADWRRDLVQLGLRKEIIKRLHRVAPGEPSRYHIVEPSALTLPIEGVIRGRGLHDELTGELFAAVATTAGDTHYVRLDRQAGDFLSDGDIVRVNQTTAPWMMSTDKVLVLIAKRNGGIYDPTSHLRELEVGVRETPASRDLVAGNVRRLVRLSTYGLVSRNKDGSWRVPPDLLQRLQAREASHPRHRLRVQYLGASLGIQATYPGPTWLDAQRTVARAGARLGFAAELDSAIRARAIHLISHGLSDGIGADAKRLDALERFLVGRRLARDLGVTFDDAAAPARGVLVNCLPLPSGRAFARVVDRRTRRLVLVPASVETSRLEGCEVEVAIDQNKDAVVRQVRRLN